MNNEKELNNEALEEEVETLVLVDDDGNKIEFEFIGTETLDGKEYVALYPVEDNPNEEYVIFRITKDENGEEIFSDVEDDDELERVADLFDDDFFSEIDYDN